jgi:DNA mismatch repair protein MutL
VFTIPAFGPSPYARAFQEASAGHRTLPLTAGPEPAAVDPWGLAGAPSSNGVASDPAAPALFDPRPPESATASLFAGRTFYSRLRYVGQVRATYLVCEGDDGVYLLDQHAAAERVTFDRLRRAYLARAIPAQRLLAGEIVELQPAEVAALEENADAVAALGLELRAVGASAVAVHAVPVLVARAAPARLVRDVVAEVSRAAGRPFGGAADLVLATMACHGSARAGDALSREEAEALLRALDEVDFSGHCPHGRPVITRLPFDDLERRVGR